MNKDQFVSHISELHKCIKAEAEKVINMFTSSVIEVVSKGNDLILVGLGQFAISKLAARTSCNPKFKKL